MEPFQTCKCTWDTSYICCQVYVPCTLIVVLSWVSDQTLNSLLPAFENEWFEHKVGFWLNREATSDRVGLGWYWVLKSFSMLICLIFIVHKYLDHPRGYRFFLLIFCYKVSDQTLQWCRDHCCPNPFNNLPAESHRAPKGWSFKVKACPWPHHWVTFSGRCDMRPPWTGSLSAASPTAWPPSSSLLGFTTSPRWSSLTGWSAFQLK